MNYESSIMSFFQNSRRNFIKNASIGVVAGLAMPEIVAAAIKPGSIKKIKLEKDNVILFQGDSITDWGRSHDATVPNASNTLGSGYVLLTAGHLLLDFAE